MIIREHKPEDRQAIEQCIFELQEAEYKRLPHYWAEPESSTSYYDYLIERLKKQQGTIFVAEIDNQVMGCVSVCIEEEQSPCVALKQYAYIPDIAVRKVSQGKGLGKALLLRAEQFGKEKGMSYIHLDVTVGNPAVGFYHDQNYTDQGTRMEKKLNDQNL